MVIRVLTVVLSLLLTVCALLTAATAGGPPACAPPVCAPPPACAPPACGPPSPVSLCGGILSLCSGICGTCIGIPSAIMGGLLAPPPVFVRPCAPPMCGPPMCGPPMPCGPMPCPVPAVRKCRPSAAAPVARPALCAAPVYPPRQLACAPQGLWGPQYQPVGPGCMAFCGNLLEMPVRLVSGVLSCAPIGRFCGATGSPAGPFGSYW